MKLRLIIKVKFFAFCAIWLTVVSCNSESYNINVDWRVTGGSNNKINYSGLSQVDTSNVKNLEVAWVYNTKDAEPNSQIQVNTIVADGILYGVSPRLKLFALDSATGTEKWVFDPFEKNEERVNEVGINSCRGVALYEGKEGKKLIFYTVGHYLYCIDIFTGKPSVAFGLNGKIDLRNDLGRDVSKSYVTYTSPGIIYKDLIIVGLSTSEDSYAAPGHIRAYNVFSGRLKWIFHTIPYPGEEGYETWDNPEAYKYVGGANVWAGFSLDEERGMVFAPTGSATDDWYGGKRLGDNLFSNSILALDAATGKLIWHYQTIHHDVWDRDLPAAPALVTVIKNGKKIDAVAQVTKTGFLFVLNRETGKPIYPIEEREVPRESELFGERLSPTQPYPTFYKPLIRQSFTESDLNNIVPNSSYQDIKERFASLNTGHLFMPPSKKPTIVFPGMTGGAEWGGPAFDPETEILYINNNEIPRILEMVNVKRIDRGLKMSNLDMGKKIYSKNCIACHGPDLKGSGDFPSLLNLNNRLDETSFINILSNGQRMMPSFNHLSQNEKVALATYLLDIKSKQKIEFIDVKAEDESYHQIPFSSSSGRPSKFETKEGYPAVSPPWGTLTAVNLNTGEFEWKIPLGDYPELKAKGIHSGTENFGGPVVTSGGLLFIAATRDEKFRAFNKRTGELLWETDLPAAGFATPTIYESNGKQFIVIACGGGKVKTKSGDSLIAFSLPNAN
ncbi:outer membrane protein assembly factor BamB family protein [Confluentibacter flavum]|uniref:Pyrrolo-quinoline quinone n=1 Tax=Confluentibacter flavum TaxID=1909700 RepID=A0A2N3HKA0_9FLAO|nr:PQQ-binding-like beta-propeller repeat protein [Confluentibacter flavum]PKQ45376.1 pyrrolo-quinoline quinone [Confluentibacter flavum]